MSALSSVESKVIAGAGGAGVGTTLAGLAVWGLDRWLLDGAGPQQVPGPVVQFIAYVTPLGCAAVAGWLAPHTRRLDLGAAAREVADAVGQVQDAERQLPPPAGRRGSHAGPGPVDGGPVGTDWTTSAAGVLDR